MILAIDVGNTNVVFGLFEGEELKDVWRLETKPSMTADEYAGFLSGLTDLNNIKGVVVATVVPSALEHLREFSEKHCEVDPLVISDKFTKKPAILIDNPSEIGDDLVANTLAVKTLYGGNTIVIDFGTATTFSVIGEHGEFTGGVIAPGVNLALKALSDGAARLPEIPVKKPKKVKGKNTVACMQSGIYWGYIGLVEKIVSSLKKEYGKEMKVVATGGLSSLIAKETDAIDYIEPNLTLLGLHYLYKLNRHDTAEDTNGRKTRRDYSSRT